MTRTGRVWGVGAGKAPSPTIRRTSKRPRRRSRRRRSRSSGSPAPARPGRGRRRRRRRVRSASWISGQVSSVVTPSTMRARGRRARWSMKYSVSKVASTSVGMVSRSVAMAVLAAMPGVDPALEPDDQHRFVEVRVGQEDDAVVDLVVHQFSKVRFASLGEHRDVRRVLLDAASVTGRGASAVAREHSLHDAGQLPIPERLIVGDVRHVQAPSDARTPRAPGRELRSPAPSSARCRAAPRSRRPASAQ